MARHVVFAPSLKSPHDDPILRAFAWVRKVARRLVAVDETDQRSGAFGSGTTGRV